MRDRAMQALCLLALEPISETTTDRNSYGFCPNRYRIMFRESQLQGQYSLGSEGDIKGCFDFISHDWLIANMALDRLETVLEFHFEKKNTKLSYKTKVNYMSYADMTERGLQLSIEKTMITHIDDGKMLIKPSKKNSGNS